MIFNQKESVSRPLHGLSVSMTPSWIGEAPRKGCQKEGRCEDERGLVEKKRRNGRRKKITEGQGREYQSSEASGLSVYIPSKHHVLQAYSLYSKLKTVARYSRRPFGGPAVCNHVPVSLTQRSG